jgi:adenosine kinase
MSALICGSLTYDTIMEFQDKFKTAIFSDPSQHLNAYFTVPDLRRQFGGSAGNISYNLKMLGLEPLPLATVGIDFDLYAEWLEHCEIKSDYVLTIEHCYTAQTFITLDVDGNQILAFHPGAMSFSFTNNLFQVQDISLATIAYDSNEGMITHALQLADRGIPFVFAPAQSITEFDGNDLLSFIEQANWILVNPEEWQWLTQQTNLTPPQVAQRVQALVITQNANEGALIYTPDTYYQIPSAEAQVSYDLAGCEDAFCAGLLYGLLKDIDWETTGRIATLLSTIKMEHHGTQNHKFTWDSFKSRFKKHFGYSLLV